MQAVSLVVFLGGWGLFKMKKGDSSIEAFFLSTPLCFTLFNQISPHSCWSSSVVGPRSNRGCHSQPSLFCFNESAGVKSNLLVGTVIRGFGDTLQQRKCPSPGFELRHAHRHFSCPQHHPLLSATGAGDPFFLLISLFRSILVASLLEVHPQA